MDGTDRLVTDRPEDVTAALASSRFSVAAPGASCGAAARLLARMARFSDGADHVAGARWPRRRCPGADGMEAAVAHQVEAALRSRPAPFESMPIATTVPVRTIAAALGVGGGDLAHVGSLIANGCEALAQGATPAGLGSRAEAAATELEAVLRPLPGQEVEYEPRPTLRLPRRATLERR